MNIIRIRPHKLPSWFTNWNSNETNYQNSMRARLSYHAIDILFKYNYRGWDVVSIQGETFAEFRFHDNCLIPDDTDVLLWILMEIA